MGQLAVPTPSACFQRLGIPGANDRFVCQHDQRFGTHTDLSRVPLTVLSRDSRVSSSPLSMLFKSNRTTTVHSSDYDLRRLHVSRFCIVQVLVSSLRTRSQHQDRTAHVAGSSGGFLLFPRFRLVVCAMSWVIDPGLLECTIDRKEGRAQSRRADIPRERKCVRL